MPAPLPATRLSAPVADRPGHADRSITLQAYADLIRLHASEIADVFPASR